MDGRYIEWKTYDHDLCKIKNYEEYKDFNPCRSKLTTRIGSEGSYGIVYELKIRGVKFAIKIFHIVADFSHDFVKKEAMFSEQLSRTDSNYFLRFVNYGYCDDFVYPDQLMGARVDVQLYRKMQYVRQKIGPEINFNNFARKAREYNINTDVKLNFPVYYMIYELGKTDLKHWIIHSYNRDDIVKYIGEVFEGIYEMAQEGIVQNDLHVGNIILAERNCGIVATIHDFGESKYLERDEEYYKDYLQFLDSILPYMKSTDLKVYDWLKKMEDNCYKDYQLVEEKEDFMQYVLEKYFIAS
jgi:tRNA A-37 threonylcarbamoyl transferase component Bud32